MSEVRNLNELATYCEERAIKAAAESENRKAAKVRLRFEGEAAAWKECAQIVRMMIAPTENTLPKVQRRSALLRTEEAKRSARRVDK